MAGKQADEMAARPAIRLLKHLFRELGLTVVFRSSLDTKLLILQRFVRMFAYGGSSLILVSFLSSLGISDSRIGLFMALTLVGDVVISLGLSLVTDAFGRKRMLTVGSLLMGISGIMFGLSANFWLLLAAATIGIISPCGNEIGPFRAIEESTLSQLTPADDRADVFAWYNLIGTVGIALGMVVSGWLVSAAEMREHWDRSDAYRVVFFLYAAVGFTMLLMTLSLSGECEVHDDASVVSEEEEESTPLLPKTKKKTSLLPSFSPSRRRLCITLSMLFGLDAFATSLATLSWTADYFKRKFSMPAGHLGSLFFAISILGTVSILVAASLARRFGNVKTMVYCHLPSAVALAFLGIPDSRPLAITLLVIRASSQYMDAAPRSSFLADILRPEERTAFMGVINVVKTGVSSMGPIITGVFVENHLVWIVFLMAGILKAVYDFSILASFLNYETEGEQKRHEQDEVDETDEAVVGSRG
ncbi:hypothetical protein CP532_2384 [Ophiocordyceps camponoti-leonardi (nom. inval.)]|nr:hypothetical protein CP532_2384 [Ophiocordyceps camponoti-leonardi (nom. inval.)]